MSNQVQAMTIAMFGAAAGAYTAELETSVAASGVAAVADSIMGLQQPLLGINLSDNSVWSDFVLANLGIADTNAAYGTAAAYFAARFEAGASRGTIVAEAVAYLLGTVSTEFTAIAAAFVTKADDAETWSIGDGAAVIGINDLIDGAGNVPTTVVFNLTAALATLAAAETAKTDFIAAQDLDEDPDTDTIEADITDLIDDAAAAGNPVKDFNVAYTPATLLTEDSTVNARNAAYAVERADAEALVLAEEDDVAAAQTAVDALDAAAEIAAYQAAKAADDAEALVLLDAQSDLAGAEAYFYTQAGLASDALVRDPATGAYTYDDDTGALPVAFGLIVVNVDDDLELATGITEADYPGVTALLAATVALEAAEVAKAATATALTTATSDLDDVDAVANDTELGLVTALATQEEQLAAAEEAAADLETAIADVEAAYALNAQLDALGGDIDDAVAAINAGGWNAVTLGGAVTATDVAGAGGDNLVNDVFLFNDALSTVTGFNLDGADLIKFDAGTYTLVVVDVADWGNAAGSSSALEIFVVDGGANTVLYVEENAFDGSTAAAQGNTIAITLTGVTGDDFALNSAGYLSVA